MTSKEKFIVLLNELLEKVSEIRKHLVKEYNNNEREWNEIRDYLIMLSDIEEVIDLYNKERWKKWKKLLCMNY